MSLASFAFGLLLAAPATAAEPVLVPDFTPGTQAEFPVAFMLQSQVTDRLLSDGYIVLTQDVVAPVVGAQAVTNCAAQPGCPLQVLPKLPTRVAVVVRVQRGADGMSAHLELFEQSRPEPVVVRDVPLPPGGEAALANEVSALVAWLVSQIGPSPDAVILAAARLIAGQDPSAAPPPAPVPIPAPVPAPVARPAPVPAPVPVPVAPAPTPRPTSIIDIDASTDGRTRPARPAPTGAPPAAQPRPPAAGTQATLGAETGVFPRHVIGSEQHYRNSGLDPRDWEFKYMPHAGRVYFEIRAGLGMGDVDRAADLRVEVLNPANEIGQSFYQEGPQTARRPRGGLNVGYAPATFMDLGVLVGLQYGRRVVSTGYARLDPEGVNPPTVNVDTYDPIDAVQLYVQPRIRAYPVPLGPAKPFLFTGGDIRVFNVYELQQPPQWSYPLPPGAVIGGWVGGGGLMLDPSPIVGFFFEGSYTQHFGTRAEAVVTAPWTYETLVAPTGVGYTIDTTGGIQLRI